MFPSSAQWLFLPRSAAGSRWLLKLKLGNLSLGPKRKEVKDRKKEPLETKWAPFKLPPQSPCSSSASTSFTCFYSLTALGMWQENSEIHVFFFLPRKKKMCPDKNIRICFWGGRERECSKRQLTVSATWMRILHRSDRGVRVDGRCTWVITSHRQSFWRGVGSHPGRG